MNIVDQDAIEPSFSRDDWLPHITPESTQEALKDFALPLMRDKDMKWLAMAVRRMMAWTLPDDRTDPERKSNAEILGDLVQLSDQTRALWQKLFELSDPLDSRLYAYAFHGFKGDNALAAAADENFPYNRYKVALSYLDWMAGFLQRAARATPEQRKNWRLSAMRDLRIKRAYYLAPAYEVAFGLAITVNNFPSDPRHKQPTPFMDFCSRITKLAFGSPDSLNQSSVLKRARSLHKFRPADFGPIVPGL